MLDILRQKRRKSAMGTWMAIKNSTNTINSSLLTLFLEIKYFINNFTNGIETLTRYNWNKCKTISLIIESFCPASLLECKPQRVTTEEFFSKRLCFSRVCLQICRRALLLWLCGCCCLDLPFSQSTLAAIFKASPLHWSLRFAEVQTPSKSLWHAKRVSSIHSIRLWMVRLA